MPRICSGRRWAAGNVSGSANAAISRSPAAISTSAPKIQRHDASSSTTAPNDGAKTGATPSTSINRDSTAAAVDPVNRSPTTATATTAAAAAPMPCNPRAMPRAVMFGANMHSSEATMCSTTPATSGRRRPSESDSGPTSSWPSASPANVPVSVNWTTDEVTSNSSAMRGSAGRYISMVSGPRAINAPRTRIMRTRLGPWGADTMNLSSARTDRFSSRRAEP